MNTKEFEISGLRLIEYRSISDERGSFSKLFSKDLFRTLGVNTEVGQVNHSFTKLKGTWRGFHYQREPFAEQKIITCLKGSILDVLLDLRSGSPTFLKTCKIELSSESRSMIIVPKGIAHGFQSIEDDVELLYIHSTEYAPDYEGGVRFSDPLIELTLPLEISEISERDSKFEYLSSSFKGLKA